MTPHQTQSPATVPLTVRVPPAVAERLTLLALRNLRSQSAELRRILEAALDAEQAA